MTETELNIINAAFSLAEEKGWGSVHLHEIAHRAGITLADLYTRAPAKQAILCLFERQINETVMRNAAFSEDSSETPREKLFEVLMARFDALKPFKPGLKAIVSDAPRDPGSTALLALMLPPSMAWMLEAAGIAADGFTGPAKVLGLTGLYMKVLRVWMTDDSEDSAKTMAELDRCLKRAEGWAKSFG
jgi:AcrR family transcriptional regulator